MARRTCRALLAASAFGLIAATAMGCGDSGDDPTSTTAPPQAGVTTPADNPNQEDTPTKAGVPTEAEIAKKKANVICEDSKTERDNYLRLVPRTETGLAKLIIAALPSIRTMTEEIGEIGFPKGDEAQVQAILAAFEAAIEEVEATPDPTTAAVAFAEADKLAENYGLVECTI